MRLGLFGNAQSSPSDPARGHNDDLDYPLKAEALGYHAWTTKDRFSHHGRFWRYDNVILEPAPLRSPHPPLWISAGRDASIRAAARKGLRLLLDQFKPVETIAERIGVYRQAAEDRFDPSMIAVARDVHIGDSSTEIEDAPRRRAAGHQRMIDAARAPGQQTGSHILAWAGRLESRTDAALYGTEAEVAAKLGALAGAGVMTVLCNILGQPRHTPRRAIALCPAPRPWHSDPVQGNIA